MGIIPRRIRFLTPEIALLCLLLFYQIDAALCQGFPASEPVRIESILPSADASASPSFAPAASFDGRYVVFLSTRNDLVQADNNRAVDVFLKDRDTDQIILVSVNLDGTGSGNGFSYNPTVSDDGRYVLFESQANDLVPDDLNNAADVFLRDIVDGVTSMVSRRHNDARSGNGESRNSVMTGNALFIAFESDANDLSENDANGATDVFVLDRGSDRIELISRAQTGNGSANGAAANPALSADGRYVVFETRATDAVPGDTDTLSDIVLFDRADRRNYLVSEGSSDSQTPSPAYNPSISASGRFIAFGTAATDLASEPNPGGVYLWDFENDATFAVSRMIDDEEPSLLDLVPSITSDGEFVAYRSTQNLFLFDRERNESSLLTSGLDGAAADGISKLPRLSVDGRTAVFLSVAGNLADPGGNGKFQVYGRSLPDGTTTLISAGRDGPADADCSSLAISGSGNLILFQTSAGNLDESDVNGVDDLFAFDVERGITERISKTSSTVRSATAKGSQSIGRQSLTSDGRFLTFVSRPSGDSSQIEDEPEGVWVKDLITGSARLVNGTIDGSISTGRVVGNPIISPDGQFVAFTSNANDLARESELVDVVMPLFLVDLAGDTTVVVNSPTRGGTGRVTANPRFVANGRILVYQDVFGISQGNVYAYDVDGSNEQLSVSFDPPDQPYETVTLVTGASFGSVVILYAGNAPHFFMHDLVSRMTSHLRQIERRDRFNRSVITRDGRFFVSSSVDDGTDSFWRLDLETRSSSVHAVDARDPSVSDDGRFASFSVVENGVRQVYVRDFDGEASRLVSVNRIGLGGGDADSGNSLVAPDGSFVVFRSRATDLVAHPTNGLGDIYLRDLRTQTTILLSVASDGQAGGNGICRRPQLSDNGRIIAFESLADNHLDGDVAGAYASDIMTVRLSSGDSDLDRMDDDWELAFFGDLSRNGVGDFDGDGATDLAEFGAGTDPADPSGFFRVMTRRSNQSGRTTVLWNSRPGATYRLWRRRSLREGDWVSIGDRVRATGYTTAVEDPQSSEFAAAFYRAERLVDE